MGSFSRVKLLPEIQQWISHSQLPGKALPLSLLHGPSLVPEVLTIFKLQCPMELPLFLSLAVSVVWNLLPHAIRVSSHLSSRTSCPFPLIQEEGQHGKPLPYVHTGASLWLWATICKLGQPLCIRVTAPQSPRVPHGQERTGAFSPTSSCSFTLHNSVNVFNDFFP